MRSACTVTLVPIDVRVDIVTLSTCVIGLGTRSIPTTQGLAKASQEGRLLARVHNSLVQQHHRTRTAERFRLTSAKEAKK